VSTSGPTEPPQTPESPPASEAPETQGAEPAPGPEGQARPGKAPRSGRVRPPVARWGAASAAYTAVVVAALVVANAVGLQVHRRFDLTANHRYTLTAPTLQVLHQLQQPVDVYGFLQSGSALGDQLRSLLREYRSAGRGKVHVQVVDPASHPGLARQYGVGQYNEVVVVAGKGHATATPADMYDYSPTGQQEFNGESAVTNAILRAANPEHPAVYFLQGDGEHRIQQNYSAVDQALFDQGYDVRTLNLIQQAAVPAGAAAVVVAGPRQDLAPAEVKALQAYARGGGHLFVLLDPLADAKLTNLYAMLAGMGVDVRDDLVADPAPQRHYQADPAALVPQVQPQAITQPLMDGHLAVLLPGSLSLAPAPGAGGDRAAALLRTSSSAYAKTNLKSGTSLAYDAAHDPKGPFDVGLAVTSTKQGDGFRAVVLGSSSFALNSTIAVQGNRDLFLNSVGWLTGRAEGVRIRPTAALQNQVFLTGNTMRGLFYGYVLFLPALCLVGGAVVWSWRRRL
jgi:hypothetical protein